MLYNITLMLVPAFAAFSFQLICFMTYKRNTSPSSSLKLRDREALVNA